MTQEPQDLTDIPTISFVRRGFSPTGGAEAYLKRLGRSLNKMGRNPALYTTKDWPQAEWPYGKTIHLAGRTPIQFADSLKAARKSDEILFSLERVWECDCYRAGDGVHRVWLNRRIEHESFLKSKFRFLNRKHPQILKLEESLFQSRGARVVIANSNLVKDEIIREFQFPADRIEVVHNGLPDMHFKAKPAARTSSRSDWGLYGNELAIVFVGSGSGRKGLQYAIRAINKINRRDIRLIVAGTTKKKSFSSGKIRFLGPVREMASVYAGADLFILPTIYDAFSNACLEALSFGLPVITTPTNGFAEIITPGIHGEIVKSADDVEGLITAIHNWIDPAKRAAAHSACIELAGAHTIERNVKETLRVLQSVNRDRPRI
jgi:UDP-glucose:(heptosyl)LPS alpha-1,3-glucosyltransferase